MHHKVNESVTMLNILMRRAGELLDVEGEQQALKRQIKVKYAHTALGYYKTRNKSHAELKQYLKAIRKESIKLEKLMEAWNNEEC